MIDLILLTGFLGAGKTTLMNSILDEYKDKKVGVIVNEFGQLNIDAKLIKRNGIEMAELSNGSIFCACIKDKFVESLIEMSAMDIDYLFIEASGLADPANMPQIISGIEHKTVHKYNYLGAFCIVDGENFLELVDMLPALRRQVEYGDAVIINKSDLIDKVVVSQITEEIMAINPKVSVFSTSYCKVDIKKIVDNFNSDIKVAKESTNLISSRPTSVMLFAESELPYNSLKAFIEDIAKDSYRIKGFSQTDQGAIEISTVKENINLNSWNEDVKGSEIVVISAVGIRILSIITASLDEHLKGKLHL